MQEGLENRRDRCTWQRIQMFVSKAKVSTTNQDYFVASVYHPPTFDRHETAFILGFQVTKSYSKIENYLSFSGFSFIR